MDLGQIGIWNSRRKGSPGVVAEIEALGYGALWLGGSPSLDQTRPYLEAGSTLPVIPGILNVWQHDPADVARGHAELRAEFGDRFLLGIGIGHPEATSDYTRPLKTMREYFDGLDAGGVPREERLAAALGPKMLDLAAERSLGTHPYFTTPEHTAFARERVGAGVLVAPELTVVVETDPEVARRGRARVRGDLPAAAQLHEQPAAVRLHRGRHRRRRQRPADRRGDPARLAGGDRRGRPRPPRRRRRPRLPAAARARPGADRGLPRGARRRCCSGRAQQPS